MKSMKTVLVALFAVTVALFTFAGCTSEKTEEATVTLAVFLF